MLKNNSFLPLWTTCWSFERCNLQKSFSNHL